MEYKLPKNYLLCYSQAEIQAKIKELTPQIEHWLEAKQQAGKNAVVVPILRGGVFFFADLVRTIQMSLEFLPLHASSYKIDNSIEHTQGSLAGQSCNNSTRVELVGQATQLHTILKKRPVLLVDDICDSGQCLANVTDYILGLGASEVKSVVLIRRIIPNPRCIPDWTCFHHKGSEWFVGYGMDDNNHWSNLPDIHVIQGAFKLSD